MRLSNLEEGSYNNTPEPRKMQVTNADKEANTEAWKRFRAGDPRYEFKNPTTEAEVSVDNEGNIAGYLDTIDEYVAMLLKDDETSITYKNEIAYRIQNAVDDIRTRELGLKPSNIRASYANESAETVNEHEIGLLGKVARQMEADAHSGDYTAIEELLHNVTEEEMESFLSDHRNDWDESVDEEAPVTIDKDDKLASLKVIDPNNRRHDDTLNEYSPKQIKMAFGILNDPRYRDGNYSGAVEAIEKLAKGLSKHPSVANALKRANESIIKEIDPSRSPWTQSGKHPGAMSQAELRREIAVFDELRDRGDHLSPKELAQEDSLYNYFYENGGQDIVDEMVKEANQVVEKAKWLASRKK